MKTVTESLAILPADAPVQIERTAEMLRLHVPSGCEISLIETYEAGHSDKTPETRIQLMLADKAKTTHYKVVDEAAQADHYSLLDAHVGEGAVFHSHVFLFGGRRIRNTLHVRLEGAHAECGLNGLYLADDEQIMETHTLIDHIKPYGTSREFYKGILDGKSQTLFDGLIIVEKDAQKTDSAQLNKNLLLSSDASAKSNPELKILANDVKCKHGSTIGQINAESLFYLRSRGIPLVEARQLLVYAFASEMIAQVPIQELREKLAERLFAKFQKGATHV